MPHAPAKNLIEGHARFCRGCGHDLVGLTGCTCPRCGRVSNPKDWRRRGNGLSATGTRVVAVVLLAGLILAIVALKFRRPPVSRGVPPVAATAPATSAATRPASAAPDASPADLFPVQP